MPAAPPHAPAASQVQGIITSDPFYILDPSNEHGALQRDNDVSAAPTAGHGSECGEVVEASQNK